MSDPKRNEALARASAAVGGGAEWINRWQGTRRVFCNGGDQ
jgi:hypothetical protein